MARAAVRRCSCTSTLYTRSLFVIVLCTLTSSLKTHLNNIKGEYNLKWLLGINWGSARHEIRHARVGRYSARSKNQRAQLLFYSEKCFWQLSFNSFRNDEKIEIDLGPPAQTVMRIEVATCLLQPSHLLINENIQIRH